MLNTNKTKAVTGNFLNKKIDIFLKMLEKDGKILNYEKEKMFKKVLGYEDENIRIDGYFEILSQGKIVRIAIDNTRTIRHDRFRGKNDEARKLKEAGLIDLFFVITENPLVGKKTLNENKEWNLIRNFNRKIRERKIESFIDNVLTDDIMSKTVNEELSIEEWTEQILR